MAPPKSTPSRLPKPTSPPFRPPHASPSPNTRLPRPSIARPVLSPVANSRTPSLLPATPGPRQIPKPAILSTPTSKHPMPRSEKNSAVHVQSPLAMKPRAKTPGVPPNRVTPGKGSQNDKENVSPATLRPAVTTPSRIATSRHARRPSIPKSPGAISRRTSLDRTFVFPTDACPPLHGRAHLQPTLSNLASVCIAEREGTHPSLLLSTPSFVAVQSSLTSSTFASVRRLPAPTIRPLRPHPAKSTQYISRPKVYPKQHESSLLLPTPSYAALQLRRDRSDATLWTQHPIVPHFPCVHRASALSVTAADVLEDMLCADTTTLGGSTPDTAPSPFPDSSDHTRISGVSLRETAEEEGRSSSTMPQDIQPHASPGRSGLPEYMLKTLDHLEDLAGVVRALTIPEHHLQSRREGKEDLTTDPEPDGTAARCEDSQKPPEPISASAEPNCSATVSESIDHDVDGTSAVEACPLNAVSTMPSTLPEQQPSRDSTTSVPVVEPRPSSKLPRLRRISLGLGLARPQNTGTVQLPSGSSNPADPPRSRRIVSDRGHISANGPTASPSRSSLATVSRFVIRSVLRPRRSEPPIPSVPPKRDQSSHASPDSRIV